MFNNKRDLNYIYRNLESHLKFWKIYNLRNKQKPVFLSLKTRNSEEIWKNI